jgi:electron transfer flavoprotein alpha subunit
MLSTVICYLPLTDGSRFSPYTWGLAERARSIACGQSRLIGVVVHSGLSAEDLGSLPFEEIYHVQVGPEQWHIADTHVYAFHYVMQHLKTDRNVYLFSSAPLYHEVAVRLSVRNNAGIITNALEVSGCDTTMMVKREIYRGKAHEFLTFAETNQRYITLDAAVLIGERQYGKPLAIREVRLQERFTNPVRLLSKTRISWEEVKLTEARCVIGIGRGVHHGGNTNEILRLAELLNAPIGGSKVADELGLIPREKRIGSSGCSLEADIYVAIGISGSSQHLEGIKGVKHVIAINSDPSAPIFQRCDLGIVGDYQEVVPALVKSLLAERQRDDDHEHLRIG